MADIEGSVKITGFVSPTDTLDTYPTHDAVYGKGGLNHAADTTARDLITEERRREGMMCYVASEQKMYILKGGIANENWQEFEITSVTGPTGPTGARGATGATGAVQA